MRKAINTAPANGWFKLSLAMGTTYNYVFMYSTTSGGLSHISIVQNATGSHDYLPVRKGQSIAINYTETPTVTEYFCFVYAEGEPSE